MYFTFFFVCSGKALWSVVCGTNVLPSSAVIGEELETASEHLRQGLHFYTTFSQTDHDSWIAASKLKDNQKSFVLRLAKLLVRTVVHLYYESNLVC